MLRTMPIVEIPTVPKTVHSPLSTPHKVSFGSLANVLMFSMAETKGGEPLERAYWGRVGPNKFR